MPTTCHVNLMNQTQTSIKPIHRMLVPTQEKFYSKLLLFAIPKRKLRKRKEYNKNDAKCEK